MWSVIKSVVLVLADVVHGEKALKGHKVRGRNGFKFGNGTQDSAVGVCFSHPDRALYYQDGFLCVLKKITLKSSSSLSALKGPEEASLGVGGVYRCFIGDRQGVAANGSGPDRVELMASRVGSPPLTALR